MAGSGALSAPLPVCTSQVYTVKSVLLPATKLAMVPSVAAAGVEPFTHLGLLTRIGISEARCYLHAKALCSLIKTTVACRQTLQKRVQDPVIYGDAQLGQIFPCHSVPSMAGHKYCLMHFWRSAMHQWRKYQLSDRQIVAQTALRQCGAALAGAPADAPAVAPALVPVTAAAVASVPEQAVAAAGPAAATGPAAGPLKEVAAPEVAPVAALAPGAAPLAGEPAAQAAPGVHKAGVAWLMHIYSHCNVKSFRMRDIMIVLMVTAFIWIVCATHCIQPLGNEATIIRSSPLWFDSGRWDCILISALNFETTGAI